MAGESDRGDNHKGTSQRGSTPHSSDGGWLGKIIGFFMRDGSLSGLAREAVKDVQSTFHEAAWGQSPHGHEPGAPLTPLHSDIEKAREFYGARSDLPSPSEIANGKNFTAAEQGQSYMRGKTQGNQQVAQNDIPIVPGGFVQREMARQKENEGGELPRGRVLPDEQLENDKGRDR